jgi:hypothetical protein
MHKYVILYPSPEGECFTALLVNADGIWSGDLHFRQQNLLSVFSIKDLLPDGVD